MEQSEEKRESKQREIQRDPITKQKRERLVIKQRSKKGKNKK